MSKKKNPGKTCTLLKTSITDRLKARVGVRNGKLVYSYDDLIDELLRLADKNKIKLKEK